jgi:hypothetical protein
MNKSLVQYEMIDGGVQAHFADGSSYTGAFLIGCDGAASLGKPAPCAFWFMTDEIPVRKQLLDGYDCLDPLLFTSLAVVQTLSAEEVAPVRALDNLLFQAINPETNVFLWHSVQNVNPETKEVSMLTYVRGDSKLFSRRLQ